MKNMILFLALLSAPAAFANEEAKTGKASMPQKEGAASGSTSSETVPAGFVIIEEQVSVDLKALPLVLMDDAIRSFKEKNYGEATGDLSAAAKIIRSVATGVEGADSRVKPLAGKLESLATSLRSTSIKSEAELKSRLAEIAYLKADLNRHLAKSQWEKRQLKRAGHDLEAAVLALEWTEKYSGKSMAKDTKASLTRARDVAEKLMKGTGWTEADVTSAMAQLESSVQKVGSMVAPARGQAEETPEEL